MLDFPLARETLLIAKSPPRYIGLGLIDGLCEDRLLSSLACAQCPRLPAGAEEGETFPLHLAAVSVCGWKVSLCSLTFLGDLSKTFERGGRVSLLEGSFFLAVLFIARKERVNKDTIRIQVEWILGMV